MMGIAATHPAGRRATPAAHPGTFTPFEDFNWHVLCSVTGVIFKGPAVGKYLGSQIDSGVDQGGSPRRGGRRSPFAEADVVGVESGRTWHRLHHRGRYLRIDRACGG